MARTEVTLEQRKGIWTLEEVHAVYEACHALPSPPLTGFKGIWTLAELVEGLKVRGLRVWGAELSGPAWELGRPQGGEP